MFLNLPCKHLWGSNWKNKAGGMGGGGGGGNETSVLCELKWSKFYANSAVVDSDLWPLS